MENELLLTLAPFSDIPFDDFQICPSACVYQWGYTYEGILLFVIGILLVVGKLTKRISRKQLFVGLFVVFLLTFTVGTYANTCASGCAKRGFTPEIRSSILDTIK